MTVRNNGVSLRLGKIGYKVNLRYVKGSVGSTHVPQGVTLGFRGEKRIIRDLERRNIVSMVPFIAALVHFVLHLIGSRQVKLFFLPHCVTPYATPLGKPPYKGNKLHICMHFGELKQ